MNKWFYKIFRYFLLILFLGYYGSITLFNHAHIVNGVTIVHSHPYKHGASDKSANHNHTSKQLVLINSLSDFSLTVLFFVLALIALRLITSIFAIRLRANIYFNPFCFFNYSLRAPPLKYTV